MNKERYSFEGNRFVIFDPELDISIDDPVSLPKLPQKFSSDLKMDHLLIKKSENQTIESAFFELKGKLHGHYRRFYPSGKVESECYYDQGRLHGPSRFLSEEGICLSETWFYFDKKQGKSRRFDAKGNLSALERFKAGIFSGKQEYFYSDGSARSILYYEKGILHGKVSLFWPCGTKKRECTFNQGIKEGWDRIWNEASHLVDEGKYKKGSPVGIHRRWHADGTPQEERIYHTPNRFNRKEWNTRGKLIFESYFTPDLEYIEKRWKEGYEETKKGKWDGNHIIWQ